MFRRLALALAILLLLAFGAWKQQDAPLEVRCGSTSGGVGWTATGARWAQGLGGWLHEVADHPEQYRDEKAVQRVLDGVAKQLWYWTMAFIDPLRGQKIDPQILQLERQAEKDAAAAEDACAPCPTTPDGGTADSPSVAAVSQSKGRDWTREQAAITKTTIAVGKSMGVPARGWVVAVTAGKTETGLRNLPYGHSSSVGVWQLIDTHGSVSQRMDVAWSARWFYRQLKAVRGWERMSVGQAAQAVERSAYPSRYAPNEAWARQIIQSFSDEPPAAKTDPPEAEARCVTPQQESKGTVMTTVAGSRTIKEPTSGTTYSIPIPRGPRGVAINFALDQVADGDWYRFGSHGPDTWDCSGLVSAAWAKAGVRFTPQTEAMLRQIPKTTSPQPGDLTYKYGHTQMLLGKVGGQTLIVEAPRTGSRMRIRPQWMQPTAVLDPTRIGESA